jgi:uncharacterized Zn finger protein (UPF0148 family)
MVRKKKELGWLCEDIPVWSKFEFLEDVTEGKRSELPEGVIARVRGTFGHANKVTANGTCYPRSLMEREMGGLKEKMKNREVLMLSDHPKRKEKPDGTVVVEPPSLSSAVGGTISLEMDEQGAIYGVCDLADTAKGRDIKALAKAGYKLGISSRARGSTTEQTITKDHYLAESNPEHIGKKVKVLNEDFELKGYDFVMDQSVSGATISTFQESEDSQMEFDLAKLTEDQWKKIMESEKIKSLIEGTVKDFEKTQEESFNQKMQTEVTKQVAEYIQSEDFLSKFEKIDDDEDAVLEQEGTCPECDATVPKGSKFCPACGTKVVAAKKAAKAESNQDMDKQIQEMQKSISGLQEENQKLKTAQARDQEIVRMKNLVSESLKSKPGFVQEKVLTDLDINTLTEQTLPDVLKKKISFVEGFISTLGIDASKLPSGSGVMMYNDVMEEKKDKSKEAKKETTEQSRQVNILSHI